MSELNLKDAAEILTRTPSTLKLMLGGLPEKWTNFRSNPESWSAFDVVGHLIHGEQTDWIPRARIILEQGENKRFEPFHRFAQFEKSKGKTMEDLLNEFSNLRTGNIETLLLFKLNLEQLELRGTHPELGEVSLKELIATWVVHDLNHIRQITVGLAQRYSGEVGAWKNYLSILN